MTLPPLTRRQREILDYFQDYVRLNGISPTLEEIAQSLGVNRVTIFGHVAELERKGVLTKTARGISRALELSPQARTNENTRNTTILRVLGTIAAGAPIEAVETQETFDLSDLLPAGREVFALRVQGNSMIEDSICDGDLVLVESRKSAADGDIVVAILPDDEHATLKRFYREKRRIRLQPSNASMEPIYADSVEIRGIVLGVIRTF